MLMSVFSQREAVCWSDKWSESELPILLQSHLLAILAVPLSEIVAFKLPQQLTYPTDIIANVFRLHSVLSHHLS
jgi:hypothetical protein